MHVGLCLFFHSLSLFLSLSIQISSLFHLPQTFPTLHLSSFHLHYLFFSKGSKDAEPTGCGGLGIQSWGDGQIMSHFRAGPKMWLWRAVTWPVAHLSTLFGLAQEARSNRATGRLELNMVFIRLSDCYAV